jgi:NAD(P)-dependent dehydrogenase (short-subunit alcohol dehydrogenase family)
MHEESRLNGKVAIVTGATRGMGRAIALRFAREGAAVVAGGRDSFRAKGLVEEIAAAGGRAEFVIGDVGEEAVNRKLVETAVQRFGRLDILVPNAGMLGLGSVVETPPQLWHQTLATNLHSVYYLLHHGLPVMLAGGGGTIVAVGSIAALKGFPNHAAYCASKGALVPLIRQVAADYGPKVRANIVCPGPVDTPLIWESAAAFPNPARAVADAARATLMGRLGTPEDVASAVLFLAGEESAWITGALLTVDGGRTVL